MSAIFVPTERTYSLERCPRPIKGARMSAIGTWRTSEWYHLVVLQRQRLLVLDGAKEGEFAGIDGQHAAGAEGVWIAGARLRGGDGHIGHNADKQCNDDAQHSFIPHLLNASLYRNPNEIYEVA